MLVLMGKPLDILLVEHRPGLGHADAEALREAGHHVERCHPDSSTEHARAADTRYLCTALDSGTCPLDEIDVDVTLLVRPHVAPRPSPFEHGVACAARRGVPVVERGPDVLDPYTRLIDRRVDGDVVVACESAAEHRHDELAADIARRLVGVLGETTATVEVTRDDGCLSVDISGPEIGKQFEQVVGLRVLEAVRDLGGTERQLDVRYRVR